MSNLAISTSLPQIQTNLRRSYQNFNNAVRFLFTSDFGKALTFGAAYLLGNREFREKAPTKGAAALGLSFLFFALFSSPAKRNHVRFASV